jgi:hypothetical protein
MLTDTTDPVIESELPRSMDLSAYVNVYLTTQSEFVNVDLGCCTQRSLNYFKSGLARARSVSASIRAR